MRVIIVAMALLSGTAFAGQPPAPAPLTTSFAFSETVTLTPMQVIGATPLGVRQLVPITGGSFAGPGLRGTVVPGGADWQLRRADGSLVIEADYMIETDDHVQIRVHNQGIIMPPHDGQPRYVRTTPQFEAPIGKYGWLNDAIFTGTLGPAGDKQHPAVQVTIFKIN